MTATCRICGQPVAAGNTFCGSCGARAPDGGAQTVQTVTQTVVPESPATQAVMSQTAPITTPVAARAYPAAVPIQAPTPSAPPGTIPGLGRWLAGSAIVGVIALIAGAVMFLSPGKASGELVAASPITAAGGKIPIAGGGQIDVPKDAVAKTERVTVRRTVVRDRVVIPQMDGQPSAVFAAGTLPLFLFGPNLTFLRPVTIVLTVGPRTIAVRFFVIRNGRLTLLTVIPARGGIVRLTVNGFQNGLLVI